MKVVTPPVGCLLGIGEQVCPVNQQQWLPVHPDVVLMQQDGLDVTDEREIILRGMILGDQDLLLQAIPTPRPVLIGPGDAEGEIRTASRQYPPDGKAVRPANRR